MLILAFSQFTSLSQSVINPFTFKEKSAARQFGINFEGVGGGGFGFLPFLGEGELRTFYDSSSVVNAVNKVSFLNLISTEGDNPTTFVEILSYIDAKSRFKAFLNVQLTDTEAADTTNTTQNVAVQKLLTSGGNISLGLNRPIYYEEFWTGNYFLVDVSANMYFDIPHVNKKVYSPGLGSQIKISGDFRLLTDSENSMGKIFRLGCDWSFVWNAFNEEYNDEPDLPDLPSSLTFATFEPYVGFLFFNLKYSIILSNNTIFDEKNRFLEVSIVPIKF